jgi:hypothetical protein
MGGEKNGGEGWEEKDGGDKEEKGVRDACSIESEGDRDSR